MGAGQKLLFYRFWGPYRLSACSMLGNVVTGAWRPCSTACTGMWFAAILQALIRPAAAWSAYRDGWVAGVGDYKPSYTRYSSRLHGHLLNIVTCTTCTSRRRRRAASRRASRRLDACSTATHRMHQTKKTSVSNFYDLYDSIEMPRSPSVFLPLTPTSIVKHSELITARAIDEYVPMKVSASCWTSQLHRPTIHGGP